MNHNLSCALSLPLEASGPWPQLTCPPVSSEGWNGLGVGPARQSEPWSGQGPL